MGYTIAQGFRNQKGNQKDSPFKVVDKEYREMIFRFNASGYVESQIIFNRGGKYHSMYNFNPAWGLDLEEM